MQRTQIQFREDFTDEDRRKIYQKSNGYCAHCGKRIEFGGQATVDHFVPLSKGGVNCDYNMVMLCQQCNYEKDNLIYQPEGYLPYLNPEDKEKLSKYFHDSYVHSFEFFQSHNILGADVLCYQVLPEKAPEPEQQIKRGKHKATFAVAYTVTFRRALEKDKEKLVDFFKTHARNNNYNLNAEDLVSFWYKFGTIYYMEQPDGIKLVFGITIGSVDAGHLGLQVLVASRYGRDKYIQLAEFFLSHIMYDVTHEQNLLMIPIKIYTFANDGIKKMFGLYWFDPLGPAADNLLEAGYYRAVPHEVPKEASERQKIYVDINNKLMQFKPDISGVRDYLSRILNSEAMAQEMAPLQFYIGSTTE